MTWVFLSTHAASRAVCDLAFPTGQDSATFRDKGTEVPSLSWDKGTTGQAKNHVKVRDGPGQPKGFCPVQGSTEGPFLKLGRTY